MAEVMNQIATWWDALAFPMQGLIESIAVVIFCVAARITILWLVRSRLHDQVAIYTWRKGTQYIFTIFAVTMITSIWFQGTSDVATYLGLLSAGVAVALKDPLANLVGWVFIFWQRPFSVGDRIQIRDMIGDVVDQRFFTFTMLEIGKWNHGEQSTGRVIHMPNSHLFAHPLVNYTEPFSFIWDELAVVVTFESDWKLTKSILAEIANSHADEIVAAARAQLEDASRHSLITYTNLSPIVYTSVVDVGVQLTIRYLTPVRRRRQAHNDLWESILDAFDREDHIDLAYPTQRVLADGLFERRHGTPRARDEDA